MDSTKIISLKQELLQKETEQASLVSIMKSKQKLKIYSIIAIPILLLISIIGIQYEDGTLPVAVAIISFVFIVPIAIIVAIYGYLKARKLKQPVKDGQDNILRIKNELIILENTK